MALSILRFTSYITGHSINFLTHTYEHKIGCFSVFSLNNNTPQHYLGLQVQPSLNLVAGIYGKLRHPAGMIIDQITYQVTIGQYQWFQNYATVLQGAVAGLHLCHKTFNIFTEMVLSCCGLLNHPCGVAKQLMKTHMSKSVMTIFSFESMWGDSIAFLHTQKSLSIKAVVHSQTCGYSNQMGYIDVTSKYI